MYACPDCTAIAKNFSNLPTRATVIGDYVYLFVYDELEPCNSYLLKELLS